MVSEIALRKLSLIKYLYTTAKEDSFLPEPLNFKCILSFHDSVELYLHLVLTEIGGKNTGNLKFLEYWEEINKILINKRKRLVNKNEMGNLNKVRVNLKHHGIIPSKSEIDVARIHVMDFFLNHTKKIFGIKFEEVSLTIFVKYQPAREALDESSKLMDERKYEEAVQNIAKSFDLMIKNYEKSKTIHRNSPFSFGDFNKHEYYHYKTTDRELRDVMKKVTDSVHSMQDALKILSLGIDYKRYIKFKMIIPEFYQIMDDEEYNFYERESKIPLSLEDCRFCFNFVIESAIKIQDFDFNIEQLR